MLGKPSRHTRRRLEENGRRASASVLEVGKRGMAITTGGGQLVTDTEVSVKLRLQVEPTGEPAFVVETKLRFPQLSIPSVGSRIAVVYDPDDHDTLMRDETPAAQLQSALAGAAAGASPDRAAMIAKVQQATASGDVQDMVANLREQFGAGSILTLGGAGGVAQEDPLDRLEKLADLKAKGVLTEDEFQAQKAKILGES
jgi:hypothetical protein